MSIEEYFGDWIRIIDRTELNKVMNILNNEYNILVRLFQDTMDSGEVVISLR